MPRVRTRPRAAAPSPLAQRLRAGGIVAPRTAIRESRRAGLPLALACALLEKESAGGHNVYGHDPSIFRGRGKVTRGNYAEYKRLRTASGNRSMQGVGPCQLTWWELQDAADAQGGCWRPEINMRVGFGHLAALVERHGEADGARRYNGTGPAAEAYSRDLLLKARRWRTVIEGAQPAGDPEPAPRPHRNGHGSPRPHRHAARDAEPAPRPHRNGRGSPRRAAEAPPLAELVAVLHRRDQDADAAWRRLVVHAHRRQRALQAGIAAAEARRNGRPDDGMGELLQALARIEGRLKTLVEVTEHGAAEPAPAASPVGAVAASATAAPQRAVGAGHSRGPRSAAELLRELETVERRRRRLRAELVARYAKADRQLRQLSGEDPPADARPRPERPADRRNGREASEDGPQVARLGDRGLYVRRSKLALARFLTDHEGHAPLARELRREASAPRIRDVASPAWVRGLEAAQRIAGRRVTGQLDGDLARLLLPYWPRDHAVKRAIRRTPAWRAIPGQLTPNFNLKELACKDRAGTPYIAGLMREQGLSRKAARARATGLARRLERVRRLGGDRPLVVNSAYRTRAYNASLTGSAENSAHTRGFAVDISPPRGVSLEQHRQHVMQAFECGIGYYPAGRGYFVHGDFDRTLGGRRIW